jgi:enoyl-CoA hydratase/carnithine racemase
LIAAMRTLSKVSHLIKGAGMTEQRVTVEVIDGVADVRLARPEKRNALDGAMFAALVTAGERLKSESGLRAVVLSGEGPDFCAGLDFGGFQAMRDGGPIDLQGGLPPGRGPAQAVGQRAAYVWAEIPVPVIAAVTGNALGGGLQIALGADIRIVAPDARLSVLEIRWGLVPDMTGTQLLPELVGRDVAKELTFSGRVVSGQEAVALGLATRVDPYPRQAALELARSVAGRSPHAIRAAKRLLNLAGRVNLETGFAAEQAEIGALIGSPNQAEAVAAEFERRPPRFADPLLPMSARPGAGAFWSGGRLLVALHDPGPAAGGFEHFPQFLAVGAVPVDVAVFQLDQGCAAVLGEADLDFAGVSRVGVVLPLGVDLPGHHQPAGRVEDLDRAPFAFAAVGVALVPAPAGARFQDGLVQIGAPDLVGPGPPGVKALGEHAEGAVDGQRHRHRVPHRGDGLLVHRCSLSVGMVSRPVSAARCAAA